MVIALIGTLEDYSRLFQKIPFDVGSGDVTSRIEFDTNEFSLGLEMFWDGVDYKSRGIIIPHSLGISKGF